MLLPMISASSGLPLLSAMPRKRPQWNGTAPPPCGMMNFSFGKVLEQVGQDDLHEHHGVGVEIIRAGGVLRRIAAAGDVDHRRHVELDHLLVERIPPLVGHRRRVEIAAGRIGIEVAADEAHLDAALELGDGVLRRHARRLRQLADADEVLRIERDARGGSGRCRSAIHSRLTLSSPMWWPMPEARGEKIVRSVPRSLCSLSWLRLDAFRISSSDIFRPARGGIAALSLALAAAVCSLRKRCRSLGSVV